VTEYIEQRAGYSQNKMIDGRFGADESRVPIELLADLHRGLYGVRSPPESAPDTSS